MYKDKKLSVVVLAALALTACGDIFDKEKRSESNTQQPEMQKTVSCQDPAIEPNVRETLQKMVRDEALKLAGNNYAQLIDADKLAAAASLLEVDLTNIKGQSNACTAQLTVRLPQRVADVSQKFAPILNMDSPNKIMQQRFSGSNATWQDNALMLPLGYAIAYYNQQFTITYSDTTLNRVGTALAVALQPYGVKDMISVNDKNMTREQAVELMSNPAPAAPSEPDAETAVREVPTLTEKVEKTESSNPNASQAVAPPPPVVPKNRFSDEQVALATQAHEASDRDIKQAWRKLDPIVQQSLVDEQKSWESQKRQRCLNTAAQGKTDSDARYLQIQCDIKLTRERIKYLQGYGIE